MTLSRRQVELVRTLIIDGFSYRKIARELGISRETVSTIAKGEHLVDRVLQYDDFGNGHVFESEEYFRCPTCGGKVLMPCLACRLRSNRHVQ